MTGLQHQKMNHGQTNYVDKTSDSGGKRSHNSIVCVAGTCHKKDFGLSRRRHQNIIIQRRERNRAFGHMEWNVDQHRLFTKILLLQ